MKFPDFTTLPLDPAGLGGGVEIGGPVVDDLAHELPRLVGAAAVLQE